MATVGAAGTNYARMTGGVAAAAKDRAGVLGKIVVTAAVTGTITVYDDASAATAGREVYVSAANPAIGTVVDLGIRCARGIWVVPGTAGTVVVAFS